jgi:hypothetical protein
MTDRTLKKIEYLSDRGDKKGTYGDRRDATGIS